MKLLRLLLLFLLPATATATADQADPPKPPVGHVLDRSDWLSRQDTEHLENELARLRKEHLLDVMVVVWDRGLPADQDLDRFAWQLGQSWAREELWAVVLQVPGSTNRPAVAFEDHIIEKLPRELVDEAIGTAVDRGTKDWTEPARLRSVALEVAEELVYLHLRRQFEETAVKQVEAESSATAGSTKGALLIRITIGAMTALLIFGTVMAVRLFIRRRGPAELVFPTTRWRRRLNAPWCGGSDLVTTFTPPNPT